MSAIAASWFLLSHLVAAPQPGSYEVIQDQFRAEKKEWGLFCGSLPQVKTSPKGTRIQLSVNGDKWVFSGGNRYFGSRICEGTLPNLGLTQQKSLGKDGVELRCATRRVTRGTERTTQTIRHGDGGKIAVEIRGTVESRKDGDLCLSTFVWKTDLAPKSVTSVEPALTQADSQASEPAEKKKRGKRGRSKKAAREPSCKKPGRPVELELEPDTLIATDSSRRACVKAFARDKNGCRVKLRKKRLKYKVLPKGAGRINRKGCFRLSATHRKDANVSIVARYKQLSAKARVVTSEPKSETLDIRLPTPPPVAAVAESEPEDQNDEQLGERRESTAQAAAPLTPENPIDVPPSEVAEGAGSTASGFPMGMLLVLAILFVGGGAALGLRQRRNVAMADVMEQIASMEALPAPEPVDLGGTVPAPLPIQSGGIRYCAKCGSEFASGGTETCPIDGEVLQWRERRVPDVAPSVPPSNGAVCPACFTRYDATVQQCYRDGAQLVPDFGQYND